MKETFYQWKEIAIVEGETTPRLLTPWADPMRYEFSMDWMFKTPEDALQGKENVGGEDEDWVLVKVTYEQVK